MYFIFQTISLFSIFLFVRSYVVIGNYSQLNPKDCGISRVSTLVDTNCFEWHKGYDSSALKRGKLVGHSDAPWVALLVISDNQGGGSCTGSVIADKWVITAAHCIQFGSTNIKIYLGYNFTEYNLSGVTYYESEEIYIHPKYVYRPDLNRLVYDLGLIKMKQSINTSAGEHSICLPKNFEDKDVQFNTSEYAMIAGWGPNKNLSNSEHRLKIAELRILQFFSYVANRGDIAETFQVDNQGSCYGDSGGPVWQYYMGRAVITAVHVAGSSDNRTGCEFDDKNRISHATWVDSQMDWILNITQNN